MKGRHGILSVTTGGTPQRFSAEGVFGEIGQYLRPMQFGMIEYMGMEAHEPFVTYAASRVSREELTAQLDVWEKRLLQLAEIIEASRAAPDREPAASDAG
jgi:NAD(P)H dehydrogenase (quinone)